jgi:hypothetical protein
MLAHQGLEARSAGVTSKTVNSARSHTSRGKKRLIMRNMRLFAPIIQIYFSVIFGYKIQNLRYYVTHD